MFECAEHSNYLLTLYTTLYSLFIPIIGLMGLIYCFLWFEGVICCLVDINDSLFIHSLIIIIMGANYLFLDDTQGNADLMVFDNQGCLSVYCY